MHEIRVHSGPIERPDCGFSVGIRLLPHVKMPAYGPSLPHLELPASPVR